MSDQDPAVRTWGESLAASADQTASTSTSALLRRLNGELDQLREQYNAVLLELAEARAAVADVERHRKLGAERLTRTEHERSDALAEVKRLTARAYQLTDKGRAATEETHG